MVRFTHAQMKKMTRRVVDESTECQPEFLAFVTALAKHDWELNKCGREWRDITGCVSKMNGPGGAKKKSTLNHLVLRAVNKKHP
ncbi:Aste57867_16222 [Aphanomyces stellatus]|uniref:Aste57867_16222 protein n=1 Tax=Aphanomyces stellatus TaxID=120398 RepID=A0A485L6A4_9STRA|nr:hypothetical protein As57867_016165 [Aphanomyces stellatus]VFT93000.1 Aste57867_16222 [Aphanomyces stellatus]